MNTPFLEAFLRKHLRTCTFYVFNGDRHCSCGRDAAWAEYLKLKEMAEKNGSINQTGD